MKKTLEGEEWVLDGVDVLRWLILLIEWIGCDQGMLLLR